MEKVTICLNMIVKNESKIIKRLFDSVLSIIDCYCICDTGSTMEKVFQERFLIVRLKILDIIVPLL